MEVVAGNNNDLKVFGNYPVSGESKMKKNVLLSFLIVPVLLFICTYQAHSLPLPNTGTLVDIFQGPQSQYNIKGLFENYFGRTFEHDLSLGIVDSDIGSTTEGSISIQITDMTQSGDPQWGSFTSEKPLIGYSLKAKKYFALYALDVSTDSGYWNLEDLYPYAGDNAKLGNFVGYSTPEPATVLLLGTGLVGLVGLRKKFKK